MFNEMNILGIDPGLEGGLVILSENKQVIQAEPMPIIGREIDISGLVNLLKSRREIISIAYLELAGSRPGQSVSSTFKFARGFGNVEAILIGLKIPNRIVTPASWTRALHQGAPSEMHPKDKSRIVLSRLFPDVNFRLTPRSNKPHEGLMDALLIAEYGRRTELGCVGAEKQNHK